MAILSNINGKFAVDSTGAIQFSGAAGTSGYVLKSTGSGTAPTWVAPSTVIGGPYVQISGDTMTGPLTINGSNSLTVGGIGSFNYGTDTTDNVRFYNADGSYAYIRVTSNSNNANTWFDTKLGATLWYAWGNSGGTGVTNHWFGTGTATTASSVKIDSGNIYQYNSSAAITNTLNAAGGATFAGKVTSDALELDYNTSYYNQDKTISVYSASNYVYVNGIGGASGQGLRLMSEGAATNQIGLENSNNSIFFNTNSTLALTLDSSQNATFEGDVTTVGDVLTGASISLGASNGRVTATQGYFGTGFIHESGGYATFGSNSSSEPIAISIDAVGSSAQIIINTGGNVGIGTTTDPTWWSGSGGGYAALQIGLSSSLAAYKADDSIELSQNTFTNASGVPEAITANVQGSRITLVDGQFYFSTLPTSGTTQTTTHAMYIASNGKVGINSILPSFQLSIENHDTTTSTATMELDGKRTNGTDGAVGELIFSNNGDTFATVAGFRDGSDNKGSLQFQTQDGSFNTKMTISSDGNVGIGTTSPGSKLEVNGTGQFGGVLRVPAQWDSSSMAGNSIYAATANDGFAFGVGTGISTWWSYSNTSGIRRMIDVDNDGTFVRIRTSQSDRVIVDSTGNVGIRDTSPTATLHLGPGGTSQVGIKVQGNSSSTVENILSYNSQAHGTGWYHLVGQYYSGGYANAIIIYGNGNVLNLNNSYGQISDEKLKENISDATPKLEDIKKLKVKNFNFKGDDLKQIGMIAQEVEEVFPGLVEEVTDPKTKEKSKSLKYSVFVPMLIKSIQELEARVKELENK